MENPLPLFKFVYNWADVWGVYVDIVGLRWNYFWPQYFLSDTSFEWHIDYEYVANTETGKICSADYTIEDFCSKIAFYEVTSQEELREDFLSNFEDSLWDKLYGNHRDNHSSYCESSDYLKMTWYKKCIRLAKKEFDVAGLVDKWNEYYLSEIKDYLLIYFKFHYFNQWLRVPMSDFLKFPEIRDHLDHFTIHQLYPPILLEDQDKMECMLLDKCMDIIRNFRKFNNIKWDSATKCNLQSMKDWIRLLPRIIELLEKDSGRLKELCR